MRIAVSKGSKYLFESWSLILHHATIPLRERHNCRLLNQQVVVHLIIVKEIKLLLFLVQLVPDSEWTPNCIIIAA